MGLGGGSLQINSKLKQILDERGFSIRKVSSDTGIQFESVRRLYNNTMERVPRDVLARLCDYLDIDIGELLKLEDEDRQE